jgi:hypothetical protein
MLRRRRETSGDAEGEQEQADHKHQESGQDAQRLGRQPERLPPGPCQRYAHAGKVRRLPPGKRQRAETMLEGCRLRRDGKGGKDGA